mmetsp:Transcript_48289/g.71569  ORF Transcript_48289/g.71569 Transcript_48289/m.71569 type:complete len:238 (-) Transcript_48289:354-1067(-)|eukprot:CAMPEP_0195514460 /NCGR_PEP_ID=MMETSP0794_2-20130614/5837_1 /TAXON_ID=515487 /ORGANISM="Stephanopyxis turris, Strain CCMP 815" /LENGTH=237 /DNA_ID=CAMNT_0040642711 /DNA_START=133 /DNA_END=846 /DNA_ORIENTATION=-
MSREQQPQPKTFNSETKTYSMRFFSNCSRFFLIGIWLLLSKCTFALPENNECENAIPLEPSDNLSTTSIIIGSTAEATSTNQSNFCGENFVSSPGVWYSFEFTTDDEDDDTTSTIVVQVSTCTNQTDFDTALTVYSGSCLSLTCVAGQDNDYECGTGIDVHSTVAWHAEKDTRYYINVHGSQANHTGNFGLTIATTKPVNGKLVDGNDSPQSSTHTRGISILVMLGASLAYWTLLVY